MNAITPRLLLAWELARQHPELAEVYLAGLRTVAEQRPELAEVLAEAERQAGRDSGIRAGVPP